jgi:hypothetical protein
MHGWRLAAAVLAFGTFLPGCAATTTTSKVAVDYNRIFAQSRNELLVTNILRASAREPMQFSTMGTVTGGVRNTGSLTIPFTNLIGGKDGLTISPSTTLNDGINPQVTIVPLGDKEFTEGILKPVSLDTLSYFFNQGWDPELILPLVVGGVVCERGDDRWLVLNRGERHNSADPIYNKFVDLFASAPRLPIQPQGPATDKTVRMPAKEGLAILKDGLGSGRKVTITPVLAKGGEPTADVKVTISESQRSVLVIGSYPSVVCDKPAPGVAPPPPVDVSTLTEMISALPPSQTPATAPSNIPPIKAYALLRSVESIIYFLGETQRDIWEHFDECAAAGADWPYYTRTRPGRGPENFVLLRIEKACGNEPVAFRTFVQTRFNNHHYYVRRSEDAGRSDRSLTTLTFLSELIALQISGSTITSTAPIIAIGAK